MKQYKWVLVGKGSQLEAALATKGDKERSKAAKTVFANTTERYNKMYSKEDREWFETWTNEKV
jgi:hypothetical protein